MRRFAISAEAAPRIATYYCRCCGKPSESGKMDGWRTRKAKPRMMPREYLLCGDECERITRGRGLLATVKPPKQDKTAPLFEDYAAYD